MGDLLALFKLLELRLGEERTDELLRVADVLGHHLGAVDDLGLSRAERAGDLAREQRLAAARRPVEQHALTGEIRRDRARSGSSGRSMEISGDQGDQWRSVEIAP